MPSLTMMSTRSASASSSLSSKSLANTYDSTITPTPSATLKPSNTLKPKLKVDPVSTHGSPNALIAQLHNLFPHHALFHVRLHIHQLSSVPLVHGEFGVKWRFRHTQSAPGSKVGSFGMRSRTNGDKHAGENGHQHEADDDDDDEEDDEAGGETSPEYPESFNIPSVVISGHSSSFSSTNSSSSTSSHTTGRTQSPYNDYLAPILPPTPSTASRPTSPNTRINPLPPTSYAPARGRTAFLKLRDHSVTWEQRIDVVVQMGVERGTTALLPNELKLVVRQRVIAGDPDAPHNPRLGAIYLNLAEYANAGPVTRRYLLRESKTNATLKLTIELEHVGGETAYTPPSLPKGEILGGVAGLLENDVYRTRPRMLALFDEPSVLLSPSAFDVDQLPLASAGGPKTTEALIEALFNPVPTSSRTMSPFTYYAPPEHVVDDIREKKERENGRAGEEWASVRSMGSDSASVRGSVRSGRSGRSGLSDVGLEFGGKPKPWWRKIASRPQTPVS